MSYIGYTGGKDRSPGQEVICTRRCCMQDFLKVVVAFDNADDDEPRGKEDDED